MSGGTSHTPKIARILTSLFSPTTSILSPSTTPTALDPSSLAARGAAIQASLIQEFEKEDIQQSTHPMVTVTPHLRHAIGVLVISENVEKGAFRSLLEAETAVPARRAGVFATPKEGGDVIVKVCEGTREIKVSKAPPKPKTNGKAQDDDSDLDDSEDDEEERREKVWKVGKVLAETAVRGVKKGGKVEVTVNVGENLGVQITAREVGGKGGVRGNLEKPAVVENGSA